MRWLVVAGTAVLCLLLAGLTLAVIVEHGFDLLTVAALLVLVVIVVGVIGPLVDARRSGGDSDRRTGEW